MESDELFSLVWAGLKWPLSLLLRYPFTISAMYFGNGTVAASQTWHRPGRLWLIWRITNKSVFFFTLSQIRWARQFSSANTAINSNCTCVTVKVLSGNDYLKPRLHSRLRSLWMSNDGDLNSNTFTRHESQVLLRVTLFLNNIAYPFVNKLWNQACTVSGKMSPLDLKTVVNY